MINNDLLTEAVPDNLYDGAILLLRSWVACFSFDHADRENILANLLTDTRSFLQDERERAEGAFAARPAVDEAELEK